MKWFRMYADVLDDPKINSISSFSFKIFVFLMSILTAEDQKDGIISNEKNLSWRLRIGKTKLKKAIDELENNEMVKRQSGAIIVVNWNKRQFKSDDINARVKRFRNVTKVDDETLHETLQVTPQNRTEQIQNRTDTDKCVKRCNTKNNTYGFDAFWTAYPKKVGKGDAEKSWKKIKPGMELVEKMLSALSWQRRQDQWTKDGGQFIPHPSTWLNQKRWEDESPKAELSLHRKAPGETQEEYDTRIDKAYTQEEK
ncbi:MAG: hypothetical protein PHC68_18815 [Syntrophorhabdaceae bacterium]|nr:hypothetical protein [Syntrophorhabdaceae bacterium]